MLKAIKSRFIALPLLHENFADPILPACFFFLWLHGLRAQIYLDELPVDPEVIVGLPVRDIAMIKIINSGISTGVGGAIAIYTRRGDKNYKYGPGNLLTNLIIGYSSIPPFFAQIIP